MRLRLEEWAQVTPSESRVPKSNPFSINRRENSWVNMTEYVIWNGLVRLGRARCSSWAVSCYTIHWRHERSGSFASIIAEASDMSRQLVMTKAKMCFISNHKKTLTDSQTLTVLLAASCIEWAIYCGNSCWLWCCDSIDSSYSSDGWPAAEKRRTSNHNSPAIWCVSLITSDGGHGWHLIWAQVIGPHVQSQAKIDIQ